MPKSRDELTAEEIAALPEGHPWKTDGIFSYGGTTFTPSDDADVEKFEAEQDALADRQRKSKLEEHYRNSSGVPERYWEESLDTYDVSFGFAEQLAAVKKFVRSETKGGVLILCGDSGTGKTHLGCGAIREIGGMYVTMQRLLFLVDSTMSYRAKETKMDVLERLCRTAGVLVLDEIGRGIREDAMKELAGYLIGERYAGLRKVILISNLVKPELVRWLGIAVSDRLNETCTFVEFSGQSYRIKKRRELGIA